MLHDRLTRVRQIVAHSLTTTVFTYTGSLTTPPCSENVTWFVAEDALSISVAQYRELKNVVGFNSRFTQGEIGDKNILAQECALGEL